MVLCFNLKFQSTAPFKLNFSYILLNTLYYLLKTLINNKKYDICNNLLLLIKAKTSF